MKTSSSTLKIFVFVIIIAISLLSFYIADIIDKNNQMLVKGILGIAMFYLIFRHGFLPIQEEPVDVLLVFPRNIKYAFYTFINALILYWAFKQLIYASILIR